MDTPTEWGQSYRLADAPGRASRLPPFTFSLGRRTRIASPLVRCTGWIESFAHGALAHGSRSLAGTTVLFLFPEDCNVMGLHIFINVIVMQF